MADLRKINAQIGKSKVDYIKSKKAFENQMKRTKMGSLGSARQSTYNLLVGRKKAMMKFKKAKLDMWKEVRTLELKSRKR